MIGVVEEEGGRFGYLAYMIAGREEEGKRNREEELPQNMKNKLG